MQLSEVIIRPVKSMDNAALALIIRKTLEEFNANLPGTVYFDESTDTLSELFQVPKASYFVAENAGKLLGGAGIYPTAALPAGICELVKMYLLPEARGLGLGKLLMEKCLETAASSGYNQVYLETMPELNKAVPMYEKFGFKYLDAPIGSTGHFGCTIQMIKKL